MSNEPVIYLEDLNKMHCMNPGCQHEHDQELQLAMTCHDAGVRAILNRKTGCLELYCFECSGHVATLAIGKKPTKNPFLKLQESLDREHQTHP